MCGLNTDGPRKLSQIEDNNSQQNSLSNSTSYSASKQLSPQLSIHRQMVKLNEPIKNSNSTFDSTLTSCKMTGLTGFPLLNLLTITEFTLPPAIPHSSSNTANILVHLLW